MTRRSLFQSLLATALLASPALAAETVYTPPNLSGGNSATVPAAREDWVARVQSNFDKTQGKHFDLVFDGDSITDFWQTKGKEIWDEHYSKLNATDFAISGDKVENVLWRLQKGQLDGIDPKLVVLMIGTNNTAKNSADQISDGIKALVADYLQRAPHARLLLLGVFPRSEKADDPIRAKIAQINQSISALASDRVTYLDIGAKFLDAQGTLSKEIMPDMLHPSPKGYQIWADAIQPEIDKTFAPAKP
jgi:lysophospholipase L1-like esterase